MAGEGGAVSFEGIIMRLIMFLIVSFARIAYSKKAKTAGARCVIGLKGTGFKLA